MRILNFLNPAKICLFWRVFLLSFRASRSIKSGLSCSPVSSSRKRKRCSPSGVSDCVRLSLFIRSLLGLPNTCLMRSLLFCSALREEAGVEAHISFGVARKEGRIVGHCWVEQDEKEYSTWPAEYRVVFKYPLARG